MYIHIAVSLMYMYFSYEVVYRSGRRSSDFTDEEIKMLVYGGLCGATDNRQICLKTKTGNHISDQFRTKLDVGLLPYIYIILYIWLGFGTVIAFKAHSTIVNFFVFLVHFPIYFWKYAMHATCNKQGYLLYIAS